MQKTAALRAAVFSLSLKNQKGFSTPPPPIRARVKSTEDMKMKMAVFSQVFINHYLSDQHLHHHVLLSRRVDPCPVPV